METNRRLKRRLVLGSLSGVSLFALVGSVTSTLAWYYQASTLSVGYYGVTVGTSGVLQIHKDTDQNITTLESKDTFELMDRQSDQDRGEEEKTPENTYGYNHTMEPVTTLGFAKDERSPQLYDAPLFLKNHWYQAYKSHYYRFTLSFRSVSGDKTDAKTLTGDNEPCREDTVYLENLTLEMDKSTDAETKKSITKALRVQLTPESETTVDGLPTNSMLLSLDGESISTYGPLDLGPVDGKGHSDGKADTYNDRYTFDDDAEVMYGDETKPTQTSYKLNDVVQFDESEEDEKSIVSGIPLGKTIDSADGSEPSYFNVVVTIWLEGWEKLDNSLEYPSWEAKDYADARFNIGLRFATGPEMSKDD